MGKCGGDEGWRSGFTGRIEVREGATGRREWPEAVKGRIVRESLEPGALVKDVARRHGIAPQQLTTWRRAAREGRLALPEDPVAEDGFGFAALVLAEEPAPPSPVEGPRVGACSGDRRGRRRDPAGRWDVGGADRRDRGGAGIAPMITPGQRTPIVIATKPVDFRRGHDGLAATV